MFSGRQLIPPLFCPPVFYPLIYCLFSGILFIITVPILMIFGVHDTTTFLGICVTLLALITLSLIRDLIIWWKDRAVESDWFSAAGNRQSNMAELCRLIALDNKKAIEEGREPIKFSSSNDDRRRRRKRWDHRY